ncbi:hypothetical protein ACET3X_005369 [Alternaria dauci]|uniref:Uncharacterized protein n=1 Tax=Alternaria dauci TaxID=48095 RepID=A0ABR3ULX6_9PLEO
MSSFSNVLQSIKNPDANTTAISKPAIKKIKIANNGSHIKNMGDIVKTAGKRTAQVVQQQATQAVPEVSIKKRKADDIDVSITKPTMKKPKMKTLVAKDQNKLDLPKKEHDISSLNAKPTAEQVSLEHIKEDALETLVERCQVAQMALDGLLPLIKKSRAIETAVAVLEQQIEDYHLSIKKLRSFGCGFELGKIKGTGSQALVALASWGLDNNIASEGVVSSTPTKVSESVVQAEAQAEAEAEAEVEDIRFSDETLAAIFGSDEEDVKCDVSEKAFTSALDLSPVQQPVTPTAGSTTNKAAVAGKKQSPKKKGDTVTQNGGFKKSKVYRSKDGELRFRK